MSKTEAASLETAESDEVVDEDEADGQLIDGKRVVRDEIEVDGMELRFYKMVEEGVPLGSVSTITGMDYLDESVAERDDVWSELYQIKQDKKDMLAWWKQSNDENICVNDCNTACNHESKKEHELINEYKVNLGTLAHGRLFEAVRIRQMKNCEDCVIPSSDYCDHHERLLERELDGEEEQTAKQNLKDLEKYPGYSWERAEKAVDFIIENGLEKLEDIDRLIDIEKYVMDETVGYAGQADLLYEREINGEPQVVLCDLKTGKGIYDGYKFQISAYAKALEDALDIEIDILKFVRVNPETGDAEAVTSKEPTVEDGELHFEDAWEDDRDELFRKFTLLCDEFYRTINQDDVEIGVTPDTRNISDEDLRKNLKRAINNPTTSSSQVADLIGTDWLSQILDTDVEMTETDHERAQEIFENIEGDSTESIRNYSDDELRALLHDLFEEEHWSVFSGQFSEGNPTGQLNDFLESKVGDSFELTEEDHAQAITLFNDIA